jgi:hypothetical protein
VMDAIRRFDVIATARVEHAERRGAASHSSSQGLPR